MAVWGLRSTGYKLGYMLLIVAALFFLLGYSTPYWVRIYHVNSGLWLICSYDTCVSEQSSSAVPGWFRAVQALQSITLIGFIVSCIYGTLTNCCMSSPSFSRFLEILTGGSGLVGFISVMVYVGKTAEYSSDYYSWGFGLDLTGCILGMIAAFLIACNNRSIDPNTSTSTQPGMVYYPTAPVQGGNPVVVQNYGPGPYQPPGGVAGYPQTYPAGPPPQYPAPPPQGYSWGQPPPQGGYGQQFQGYSAYNYPHGYSGAPNYPQTYPQSEEKPAQ